MTKGRRVIEGSRPGIEIAVVRSVSRHQGLGRQTREGCRVGMRETVIFMQVRLDVGRGWGGGGPL